MSVLIDVVVARVRGASLQELTEFAAELSHQLSIAQLAVIENALSREKARREPVKGMSKPWGI